MQVKKQQLEPDMEQQTGSKLGKEHIKTVHCHPAYSTSMQSISCEMQDWMRHKLESRLPREKINYLRDADDTTLMAGKQRGIKQPLDKSKRGRVEKLE